MKRENFVSLFSGAGGLDLGLEVAGWRNLYASDVDAAAVNTLIANRGRRVGKVRVFDDAIVEQADVRSLTGQCILGKAGLSKGAVPLLVGGPPCQSWSSAGHQKGWEDPRGRLFDDFIRVANQLDVRWLLFENVRGLLTARGPDGRPGSALELIRRKLLSAGFQTEVTLINAADYGVGQRRVRLIVFGYRTGDPLAFPKPTHDKSPETSFRHLKPWMTLGDVLSEIAPPNISEIRRPTPALSEQMKGLPPGTGVKSAGKKEATRPGGHWGYKQGAFIADLAKPARTVTANAQQDWIRDPIHGLRKLTPRESAAIQSFPSNWVFEGRDLDCYRLIGNAVPPRLACRIGQALGRHDITEPSDLDALRALSPLPEKLISAIRYTEREEFRNGPSRRAAPDRRARRYA